MYFLKIIIIEHCFVRRSIIIVDHECDKKRDSSSCSDRETHRSGLLINLSNVKSDRRRHHIKGDIVACSLYLPVIGLHCPLLVVGKW